jgi:hypothetical protein
VLEKLPSNRPDYSLLSKAWNIGLAIVILTLLGHWIDKAFHASYIFTLVGAALGFLYSLYEAWTALK